MDGAFPGGEEADDDFQQRCLAGAVGPEQDDGFFGFDVEAGAPEDLDAAVAGLDSGGAHDGGGVSHGACRCGGDG